MIKATVRSMVAIHHPDAALRDYIRKTMRYTNPVYVAQLLHGSKYAAKAPKFIAAYIEEDEKDIIWVPRAWFYNVLVPGSTEAYDIKLDSVEKSAKFPEVQATPLPHQMTALTEAIDLVNANDSIGKPTDSYIVLPPGGGKTILGMFLIASCRQKSLVIVPTQEIEEAWMNDAPKVFGPNAHGIIGHIRGKKCDVSRPITIASIQTLMDMPPHLWASEFGLVLYDEMHRLAADVFSNTVKRCRANIRFGLTATDYRKDGRFIVVRWHLGSPCFRTEERLNTVPLVYAAVMTPHGLTRDIQEFTYNDLVQDLCNNQNRTDSIAWLTDNILKNHHGDILIVSSRTDHLLAIACALERLGQKSFCIITGDVRGAVRKQLFKDVLSGIYRVTLATTSIMSEGASNPRWHHVINTLPFSDPKTSVQLSGRPLRKDPNNPKKTFGFFWDLVDANPMCRAMNRHRWKAMRKFLKETRAFRLTGASPFSLTPATLRAPQ